MLITRLGTNAIPAGIMFLGGNSAATAMVLYFLENIVSVLLAAARVRILAPADDAAYADRGTETVEITTNGSTSRRYVLRNRRVLILDYLFVELFISLAVGVFLFSILFLYGNSGIPGSVIQSGMVGILAFQLFHFVSDLFLMGPLTAAQAESLLQQSGRRVMLIFLATIIGFIAAFANITWFAIPFVALRTLTDLTTSIQAFRVHVQFKPEPVKA